MVPVKKQYDPHWPFPQYDEQGKQLMPPGWNKKQPKPRVDLSDVEEALM